MSIPAKHTFHLHLLGQVQGVGFRPFVWRLARRLGLQGWVNNTTDGVHVVFNAGQADADDFVAALLRESPVLARITGHHLEMLEYQEFAGFQITHSSGEAAPQLLLAPDFALCDDCRRELHDPANRRYGYAFITCTNCGPRFSIVTGLPYDRERTTMQAFQPCPACQAEYDNPADRRYYSQTNSCPNCGIVLRLTDPDGRDWPEPLQTAMTWLRNGKILAVKGIGGYLLLCDATNPDSLRTLRRRKHRPAKPFALLYADRAQLERDTHSDHCEIEQLNSPAAPIVLLPYRATPVSGLCTELVAPGLDQIGVMLPYAPLLDQIAKAFGKPLVATSGNISGSPIIYEDDKAQRQLSGIADAVLSHNRDIVIPQDDSVIRFSPKHRQPLLLRRSRGFAPTFLFNIQYPNIHPEDSGPISNTLALGATMKSTFAWQHRGNTYVSQYLGDLESFETQQAFEYTLNHFLHLLRDRPERLLVDKHPDYFSNRLGQRLAAEWNIPWQPLQHHRAHFAAVLAENGYLSAGDQREVPVLGVIWDGTGYGDDGQVWGGEFFRYDGVSMERAAHFESFDFLLGDKMPREPRISALSLAYALPGGEAVLRPKFSSLEWDLYNKMLKRGGLLQTTSAGRLFDGVAALMGLIDRSSYEGEAAMLLEQAATRFFRREGYSRWPEVLPEFSQPGLAPTHWIVQEILREKSRGAGIEKTAAYFHVLLIETIRWIARSQDCGVLAFSGGVWQNALLVDLALEWLQPEFTLLFHRQLPPNDESVSFGQLFLSQILKNHHPAVTDTQYRGEHGQTGL